MTGDCSPEDTPRLTEVGCASGSRRQLLARRRFDEAAAAARRIAHDYGNILTGILGFSELAQGQLPADSQLAGYLSEVHRSAQQGERLTNTLRLFARRDWPRNEPAQVAAVVAEERRRLHGQFPAARLDVTLPPGLPPVGLDAEPLRHVLAQLLDNAAEAVAAGGDIRLSARAVTLSAEQCLDLFGAAGPGPHVEVVIEDTGCGLSPDARQRVLVEPFFTTKRCRRGYGLAVAYGILAAHRGALAVESAPVGTVARAYLPVAPEPSAVLWSAVPAHGARPRNWGQ
jgi:signal transduction histidine kinase